MIFHGLTAYVKLRQRQYRFTGESRLNEVTAGGGNGKIDVDEILFQFCQTHCILDRNGFVSLTELHMAFQRVAGCPFPGGITAFSAQVGNILDQIYPGAVSRRRTRVTENHKQERGFIGVDLQGDVCDFRGMEHEW